MRTFGTIHVDVWRTPEFRGMTDEQRSLWIYLQAGPHNTVSGSYFLPAGYVTYDLNWPQDTVERVMDELGAIGVIVYDRTNRRVVLKRHLERHPITNVNAAKALVRLYEAMPNGAAKLALTDEIDQFVGLNKKPPSDTLRRAFEQASKPLRTKEKEKQVDPSHVGRNLGEKVVSLHAHAHARTRNPELDGRPL